jgi:single-stranded-DNA-specific exonuclease
MLRVLGLRVEAIIPDRIHEGYGFTMAVLDRMVEHVSPSLCITVDCGTNSVEEVRRAAAENIDVIVTDHHQPAAEQAEPFAMLNPQLEMSEENKVLCGAGVAFKLIHGVVKRGREKGDLLSKDIDLRTVLDLVALATVADIVPLTGENRMFVRYGLQQMARTEWRGLRALLEKVNAASIPTCGMCGFQLGPRLNAAGRMRSAEKALRLLVSDDERECYQLATELDRLNEERRLMESRIYEEAVLQVEKGGSTSRSAMVCAKKGWHHGVLGIVASRVSRHYHRPAVLLTIEPDGTAKGSARGVDGFNLLEALAGCSDSLERFGGHRMAAGLTVKSDQIEPFSASFECAAGEQMADGEPAHVLEIDAWVERDQLDASFYNTLRKMEPFGEAFREPIFAISGARIVGEPRVMAGKHLRFSLDWMNQQLSAVAFNVMLEEVPAGRLDIAFVFEENVWQGRTTYQLNVRGMKPAL